MSTQHHLAWNQLSNQSRHRWTISVLLSPPSHAPENSKLISSHLVTTSQEKEAKFPDFAFQQQCNLNPLCFWHSVSDFQAELRVGNKYFLLKISQQALKKRAGVQGLTGRMYQTGHWTEKEKEREGKLCAGPNTQLRTRRVSLPRHLSWGLVPSHVKGTWGCYCQWLLFTYCPEHCSLIILVQITESWWEAYQRDLRALSTVKCFTNSRSN